MSRTILDEVATLASRAIDGQATEQDRQRLEELLRSSAEARTHYVRFMAISAQLAWDGREQTVAPVETMEHTRRWRAPWRPVAVAAAVLVVASVALWFTWRRPPAATDTGVAMLTAANNLEWEDAQAPRHVGNVLKPGWLRLKSGVAHIEFFSGPSVWVEGPAAFRLESSRQGFIESGRVVTQVPQGSQGFHVGFPGGLVAHKSSWLGLQVAGDQASVHVLDGLAELKAANGSAFVLRSGESAALDAVGSVRLGPSDPHVFDYRDFVWTPGGYMWSPGGNVWNPGGYVWTPGGNPWAPGAMPAPWGAPSPWSPWGQPYVDPWRGWDPLESVRQQLGVDPRRWAFIQPRLSVYLSVQQDLRTPGWTTVDSPLSRAAWDLWLGVQNPDSSEDDLAKRMRSFREARTEVESRRDAMEIDLHKILSPREEAILVNLGYIR